MYGGLLTIASSEPRRSSDNAAYQCPCPNRAPTALRPTPAALARATCSASSDTSVIQTSADSNGNSCKSDSPTAPDPVPRSAIVTPLPTSRIFCNAYRVTCSTKSSVSGRGMSTRESTSKSRRRNAHRPITYCNGSPAAYRASMLCRC